MTARTPERLRRDAAREAAEQLAVVVGECTWNAAKIWLHGRMADAQFGYDDLALVLASMTEPNRAYRDAVAERFDPLPVKPK